MQGRTIEPRWTGLAIVAATGPSLTLEVAEQTRGFNSIAVNDAYRLMPFASVLYACDVAWWNYHKGCQDFPGEKWSSCGERSHDKFKAADRYGINLVQGQYATERGFSFQPDKIHYGSNSGFQAVNLALLFGATRIALVGFDMQFVDGRQHFFGSHPKQLNRVTAFVRFIDAFDWAAKLLPPWIEIINCTPGSALKSFPMGDLKDVIKASQ